MKVQRHVNQQLHAKAKNRIIYLTAEKNGVKMLNQWMRMVHSFNLSVCQPSASSVNWACWVKKKPTCSLTKWEVTLNALALYARVKASCKLAEAKSILLWFRHCEKAQGHPEMRDRFASLICSLHSHEAGERAVNFTLCSACPAAGSLLLLTLSQPAQHFPLSTFHRKTQSRFPFPPGFAVYSVFSSKEIAKRQPSLLLAHSLLERSSTLTATKHPWHNGQALKQPTCWNFTPLAVSRSRYI